MTKDILCSFSFIYLQYSYIPTNAHNLMSFTWKPLITFCLFFFQVGMKMMRSTSTSQSLMSSMRSLGLLYVDYHINLFFSECRFLSTVNNSGDVCALSPSLR